MTASGIALGAHLPKQAATALCCVCINYKSDYLRQPSNSRFLFRFLFHSRQSTLYPQSQHPSKQAKALYVQIAILHSTIRICLNPPTALSRLTHSLRSPCCSLHSPSTLTVYRLFKTPSVRPSFHSKSPPALPNIPPPLLPRINGGHDGHSVSGKPSAPFTRR